MIRQLAALTALALAALLPGCQGEERYRENYATARGPLEIAISGARQAEQAAAAAAEDYRFTVEVSHPYLPGPMGRINQLLATTAEFSANPSLLPLIRKAREYSLASDGLYNPALGGLLALWGFHRDEPAGPPPAPDAIGELLQRQPSMADLETDGIRMRSKNPAVQLDLGDFALGYALDVAAERLREAGVPRAVVANSRGAHLIGAPTAAPFLISLPGSGAISLRPGEGEAFYQATAEAPAFEHEGRRYHALLDPRTGYPAKGVWSVTVIEESAAAAAAVATAVFIAGRECWRSVAEGLGAKKVLVVGENGQVDWSEAMAPHIQLPDHAPVAPPPPVSSNGKPPDGG